MVRAGLLTLCLSCAASASAQTGARELALTSIEDLMQIEVTSAGRKEQRAVDVAAASFVITQDDIRQSGIRSLPELFRLVPGMQVAQVNANKWAVSIRGFNDVFSNKVLVLIDGRSIYKRTFSGVFWHAEDVLLENIERIEIIRGPGGATWGANAVNGVINIITKSAADTKGGMISAGAGNTVDGEAAARYGGRVNGIDYRVSAMWSDHDGGADPDGSEAPDTWRSARVGVRADWSRGPHTVMAQSGFLDGRQHALWVIQTPVPGAAPFLSGDQSSSQTFDVTARWTYAFSPQTSLQVQSFYSRQDLVDPSQSELESTGDVDLQFRTRAGRHDLVGGGGYRMAHHADNGGSYTFSLQNAEADNHVVNAFLQDEIDLGRRFRATLGAKIEHDTTAGASLQPTARLMWNLTRHQHVWGAISRAVRTPSLTDLSIRTNFAFFNVPNGPQGVPVMLGAIGNPDYETETFTNAEAGYRVRLGTWAALDLTVFRGDYDGLPTQEPVPPVFETSPAPPHVFIARRPENLLEVKTTGVEAGAQLFPAKGLRFEASYSGFAFSPRPDQTSQDPDAAEFDANTPTHQWQVRGSYLAGPRVEISAGLFHVGALDTLEVPAYTRADARVEVQVGSGVSVSLTGQNLFDETHVEFRVPQLATTQVRRSVHFGLGWRF